MLSVAWLIMHRFLKNIISTHKKTYEYLYDLVEMIEEPFHIQFSDSDIASLITIIKEI